MIKDQDKIKKILGLWDAATQDIEGIFDSLMDGKSESAALMLQQRLEIMRGQSRDFLIRILKEVEGK